MKFSSLFCPTLKQAPNDAEIISHQLMVRSGMIRRLASGVYSYLPLGLRAIRKFEQIVRDELNRCGAQEILMPSMIPSDLWIQSERWDKYGPELIRFTDRHNNQFCLGPTHEEVVSLVANNGIQSYKQLPLTLYQIQTKYRDEIRPRFGLMRGREFGMKDAYSFHDSEACLDTTYKTMIDAYYAIFKRCGLSAIKVDADSGSIGGDVSAEFMIQAQTGEDTVLACDLCDYAGNSEVHTTTTLTCPCCNGALQTIRGIEVGHVFKLGTLYSSKMMATYQSKEGKQTPFLMGCYGIGIGRTIAATIESHHDDNGIKWPMSLAPYSVVVILSKPNDANLAAVASHLYSDLLNEGVDVVFDDRSVSVGVKFKDAQLIGFPIQLVVGQSYVSNKSIECITRSTGHIDHLSVDTVVSQVTQRTR